MRDQLSKHTGSIITVVVIATIILWFYWNRPTIVKGTGPVNEVAIRRGDVQFTLKNGVKTSQIFAMDIFEDFTFESTKYDAERILGPSDKNAKDREARYSEYIRKNGRLRFFASPEYGEEGGIVGEVHWIEVLPNELFADRFFDKHLAKHLDLTRPEQLVYVPLPTQRCYVSVTLNKNRIIRISWLPHDP